MRNLIIIATYSYDKKAIETLERNRDIIINTLHYPENHRFIWLKRRKINE